jgi:hypothetical protein
MQVLLNNAVQCIFIPKNPTLRIGRGSWIDMLCSSVLVLKRINWQRGRMVVTSYDLFREPKTTDFYRALMSAGVSRFMNVIIKKMKYYFFFIYCRAPQQILMAHRSLEGLLCNPVMTIKFFLNFHFKWIIVGMKLTETYPSATWSTTNPTWTDPGSNSGLRG